MNWRGFESRLELADQLAARIADNLRDAIAARGSATLAVSGGSTPRPLFGALAQRPLDWTAVRVTQVDERWVAEDHADSNALLIRDHLLRGPAAAAEFVSMKVAGGDAFAAQTDVAHKLKAFASVIDVVVLGMGDDGHTASFFPGADTLTEALDPDSDLLCLAVRPPAAPHDRMTLSLAALLRSRHLYLHITGAGKRAVWQRACEPGAATELPIRAVITGKPGLEVYFAP